MLIGFQKEVSRFFQEDDLGRNGHYFRLLPEDTVHCSLKFKDDLIIAGLPYFESVFNWLDSSVDINLTKEYEAKKVKKSDRLELNFDIPFNIALTGERIALNLLQHTSSIATYTSKFVEKAEKYKIKILDTRKTTPGLRAIEKYGVVVGGGHNHRFGQNDVWMVKDNHKNFFGGIKSAVDFFKDQKGFYTPIEVEVHNLDELQECIVLGIKHCMLDNFLPEDIFKAISIKPHFMSYEVSGGIRLDTIDSYLIEGVDAISIGSITYGAPPVDISLKYSR